MDAPSFHNRFAPMILPLVTTILAGCSGGGDSGSSGSAPSVSFSASESVVSSGDSVMLTWSSSKVTSCRASGGWSGTQAVQGSAAVGPISRATTFTLTCTGDAGNAVAMLSVSVLGLVTLQWQAPTMNVDGSPLTDLAGYRIHYGQFSRSYTDAAAVPEESRTRYELELPSGSYYVAMTALDAEGNESAYSNEVLKVVD